MSGRDGGEAKRQEGELPQELPETEPAYVGTGTGHDFLTVEI